MRTLAIIAGSLCLIFPVWAQADSPKISNTRQAHRALAHWLVTQRLSDAKILYCKRKRNRFICLTFVPRLYMIPADDENPAFYTDCTLKLRVSMVGKVTIGAESCTSDWYSYGK